MESKTKWYRWTYSQNRKRLTDLENKLMVARADGIVREVGMDRYTLLYLKWIINKDLLYSTGNSAQCYVAARMEGEFGGEYTWLCMAESLHYSPEILTTLLISYNPIQNKMFVCLFVLKLSWPRLRELAEDGGWKNNGQMHRFIQFRATQNGLVLEAGGLLSEFHLCRSPA